MRWPTGSAPRSGRRTWALFHGAPAEILVEQSVEVFVIGPEKRSQILPNAVVERAGRSRVALRPDTPNRPCADGRGPTAQAGPGQPFLPELLAPQSAPARPITFSGTRLAIRMVIEAS